MGLYARLLPEAAKDPADCRSEFERDRARILHSAAFRRLQGKTQVHGVGERDFFRTRLTHSLECAQIGRALALRLWQPPYVELVEAACLAHDLGHPPFGHTGEKVLNEQVPFEGNAQTFRVLTRLESKIAGGGLNLCRATLVAILKYPFKQMDCNPKFIYREDEAACSWALDGAPHGLLDSCTERPVRSFATEIMEWADDVAYSTHDLEDGIVGGFLSRAVLESQDLRQKVRARARNGLAVHGIECEAREVEEVFMELESGLADPFDDVAVKGLVNRYIHRLVLEVRATPRAHASHPLFASSLEVPAATRRTCEILKALVWFAVIQSATVERTRDARRAAIRDLFAALLRDAETRTPGLWPEARLKVLCAQTSGEGALRRAVADYIAGMTDAFALRTHKRLDSH